MDSSTILETARLRLRTWELDDWQALRRLAVDPRVMRYISNGQAWDDGRIRAFVEKQIRQQRDLEMCLWKATQKESEEVVGMCGLQPLEATADIEIGWWLAPELWGRGIATEAARAALAYGFDTLRLKRIVAVAMPENAASIRIMEKLGMRYQDGLLHKGFEVVRYAVDHAR